MRARCLTGAPRVSVLMPARDAAPWIGEALLSIERQSLRDWELLVCDDGSRDATVEIVRRWAARDPRVRLLEPPGGAPGGIATALNRLFREARGAYVARMDADDIAEPERLATQLAALEGDSSLFAVSCAVAGFPLANLRAGMRAYLEWHNGLATPQSIRRERFVECPVLHPSLMMRRGALLALGGWRERRWPEDWDLVLRAIAAGLRIGRVRAPLLRWRLHAAQTCRLDRRYGRDAFVAARAHFLARALVGVDRPLFVLGAGPTGKSLARALAAEGAAVAGFADVDRRKIGTTIGRGCSARPVVSMERLFAMTPRPFALAAVARPGARARIRRWLDAHGWKEEPDDLLAA